MQLHPAEPAKPGSRGEFFTATTSYAGRSLTARTQGAPVMELARVLVAAGCPEGPWQAERSEQITMTGASIHRLAKLAVSEGGANGPRLGKYQIHHMAREAA
ncbi:MAG TPA: hypothetical protein PLI96_11340 [Halothiobacillus sp.]|nr:hypothetical protein [Halothiobacillus sp.]